jgi:hypothetical protein
MIEVLFHIARFAAAFAFVFGTRWIVCDVLKWVEPSELVWILLVVAFSSILNRAPWHMKDD